MSDETMTTQAETPVNDEPQLETTADVAAETTETAKPSVEDDLSDVWDKMHAGDRERDENGRFKGKDDQFGPDDEKTDDEALAADDQPKTETPPQQYADPVEAVRAKWNDIDPDARHYITAQQRELDQVVKVVQAYEPIGNVLQTHRDYLNAVAKQDVPGYLNNLLTYSRQLDADPAGTLLKLADMYGVDLASITDPFNPAYVDPATAALKQELTALKQQMAAVDQQRQTAEQQRAHQEGAQLLSITEAFFAKNPDAEQLADDIELEVRALKAKNPAIDPQTALEKAYERAQWTNDGARQAKLKAEAEKAEKARADAAKKLADQARRAKGINVNGAAAANRKPMTVEETMSSVWDRLHS